MSMDKRSIYDGLNQLENELQNSLNNLAEMKQSLQEIVEKNTTLELENQRLRNISVNWITWPKRPQNRVKQELSQIAKWIWKRYTKKGFHVCYDLYGSRREHDEPCAFCLEVIYRESGRY